MLVRASRGPVSENKSDGPGIKPYLRSPAER